MSNACAEKVRIGDPDRFLAVMAAPPGLRAGLFVLYAFNLEIARAPWVTEQPLIAEMRLQWWLDVVAAPKAPAHEVAGPLHALIVAKGLPVEVLDRLIAARRWDCGREAHADQAALDSYLEDTGAGLMWLAHLFCGGTDEAAARNAGWAAALAAYLRAAPALAAAGRVPLVDDGHEAIATLARRGFDRLTQARGARGAALLAGWQAGPILRQVIRDPGAVAEGRLGLSEFRRRGRLLWCSLTGRP